MHPNCPHGRACSFKHVSGASRSYIPSEEIPSPLQLSAPLELKERSASLPGTALLGKTSNEKNALSLTLQSYSLSDASSVGGRPAIVVQNTLGPNEKMQDQHSGYTFPESPTAAMKRAAVPKRLRPSAELQLAVPSSHTLRARSSPSSPVSASLELPNVSVPNVYLLPNKH